jgi:hypothetical protein
LPFKTRVLLFGDQNAAAMASMTLLLSDGSLGPTGWRGKLAFRPFARLPVTCSGGPRAGLDDPATTSCPFTPVTGSWFSGGGEAGTSASSTGNSTLTSLSHTRRMRAASTLFVSPSWMGASRP